MKQNILRIGFLIVLMILLPGVVSAQKKVKKIEDELGVYEGGVRGDLRHGQGTNVFPDGQKYVGEWKDGAPNGKGKLSKPDGSSYEGDWKMGTPHGRGTFVYPDGVTYVGEIREGRLHGQGTYTTEDGRKLVGVFNNGVISSGEIYLPDGSVYKGEITNTRPSGKGVLKTPEGTVFDCEWRMGAPDGQGTITDAKGNKYIGQLKDAKPHGEGTSLWVGGDKYVGRWSEGLPHGQGTYTFASGEEKRGIWNHGIYQEDSEGQVKSEFKISMGAGSPLASVSYSGTTAQASAQDAAPQEPAPATKKDPGPLRLASKTEKMQALLDEAIKRAEGFDGVYTIVNDYDFVLKPEDLSAFLRKKGYSIGQYSTKNIMLVGNFAGVGGMVDELDFYKPDCLRKYAYYVLRGKDQEEYSRMDKTGYFYFQTSPNPWTERVDKSTPVYWSGSLVNGLLDGPGVGLVLFEDGWGFIEATFRAGFPTDKVPVEKLFTQTLTTKTLEYPALPHRYLLNQVNKAEGDFREALKAYSTEVYPEYEKYLESEYRKALTLNKTTEKYSQDADFLKEFIDFYSAMGTDSKNLIPKAQSILDAYSVLNAVKRRFSINDYTTFGPRWNWSYVDEVRSYYDKALASATAKAKIKNGAFQPFYASATTLLTQKRKDLEKHIVDSEKEYESWQERDREQSRLDEGRYQASQLSYDAERSYPPSGKKVGSLLGPGLHYEKNGELVLQNGHSLEYTIYYHDNGSVMYYKVIGSYPSVPKPEYESFEAMLNAFVAAHK